MLVHLLPDEKKTQMLEIARILLFLEHVVLWIEKNEDESIGEIDLSKLSFKFTEAQRASFQILAKACEKNSRDESYKEFDDYFLDKIKQLRLSRKNNPADRLEIPKKIIQELTNKQKEYHRLKANAAWPFPTEATEKSITKKGFAETRTRETEQSRIILFELMKFSAAAAKIPEFKKQILQFLANAQGIDEEYFNELLTQALAVQKEITKSINLILE